MKDLKRSGLTREQWSAMTLYEKFEQVVIFVPQRHHCGYRRGIGLGR